MLVLPESGNREPQRNGAGSPTVAVPRTDNGATDCDGYDENEDSATDDADHAV